MENQIFSLGRFTAYLKKYLSENRSIRLQFIILTGVFSALLAISGGSMNFFNLSAAMFIFAIVLASSFSAYFSTRANKIKFMLTPVSQLEKFLAMVLHLYVVVPVMFIVVLFIAQYVAILITALFTLSMPRFTMPFAGIEINKDLLLPYFISYFSASAFYLMGATLFTRHSFLKTTGLSIALGFITSMVVAISGTMQIINIAAMENLAQLNDFGLSHYLTVANVVSVIMILLFLFIGYMRVSEMETNETRK